MSTAIRATDRLSAGRRSPRPATFPAAFPLVTWRVYQNRRTITTAANRRYYPYSRRVAETEGRMVARPHNDSTIDQVLEIHDHFDPPGQQKAQVIEGRLVVSPIPTPRHGLIFTRLGRQINRLLPEGMDYTNNVTSHARHR
jgi:hypothetical protein